MLMNKWTRGLVIFLGECCDSFLVWNNCPSPNHWTWWFFFFAANSSFQLRLGRPFGSRAVSRVNESRRSWLQMSAVAAGSFSLGSEWLTVPSAVLDCWVQQNLSHRITVVWCTVLLLPQECVSVRARACVKEREGVCVCVRARACVCVCERERERGNGGGGVIVRPETVGLLSLVWLFLSRVTVWHSSHRVNSVV